MFRPVRHDLLPAILLIFLTLAASAGCDRPSPSFPARQAPAGLFEDALQVELGRQLFRQKCVSCHGKQGEGRSARASALRPPAPNLSERIYRAKSPAYLFWRIDTGNSVEPYRSQGSVMPGWGAYLSEQQIWQLVAYLAERAS